METQEKKKNVKPVVIAVIITLLLSAAIAYLGGQSVVHEAYDRGYDAGYDDGKSDGYDTGKTEGYNDGFNVAKEYFQNNNSSNALAPNDGITSTDEAPAGTVFVTKTGDKYHENGCQYISGKHNLTAYSSASEAENAGYSPCSVCH